MSYDVNFNYTRLENWVNDKALAIAVTASRVDTEANDMAAALTQIGQAALRGPATGDVTTPGGVPQSSVFTISAGAVTLAKMANLAANSILGNNTGAPATPLALTAAQVKALLAVSLTTDVTGTLQAAQMPALAGDVTSPGGSLTTTIAAGAVTLAKMANLAANSIIGNNTGGGATPIALTPAQVKTLLAITEADVANLTTDLAAKLGLGGGTMTGELVLADVNHVSTLAAGFRGTPVITVNGVRTFGLTDSGKRMYHDEATARIWTIDSNANVAMPLGTVICIDNTGNAGAAGTITLQITTDTLRRGDGTAGTGTRTISAGKVAWIAKTKTTEWCITGVFT